MPQQWWGCPRVLSHRCHHSQGPPCRKQAAVTVTSGRTACLIQLIMGKVPGVCTDVLLPCSGKSSRLQNCLSLFPAPHHSPSNLGRWAELPWQVPGEETGAARLPGLFKVTVFRQPAGCGYDNAGLRRVLFFLQCLIHPAHLSPLFAAFSPRISCALYIEL